MSSLKGILQKKTNLKYDQTERLGINETYKYKEGAFQKVFLYNQGFIYTAKQINIYQYTPVAYHSMVINILYVNPYNYPIGTD